MHRLLTRLISRAAVGLGALVTRRRNNKNRKGWEARFAAAHQASARELDRDLTQLFASRKPVRFRRGRLKARLTELCGGAK